MYTSLELKESIKERAAEKNILIRDMLSECGLGVNTVSQISDKNGLSCFSLARIADYLDCSVDYLLGRTENPVSHKVVDSSMKDPPDLSTIMDNLTGFQKGQVIGYIQRMLEESVAADQLQDKDLGKAYPSTGTEGPGK